jgi:hypothetical protein
MTDLHLDCHDAHTPHTRHTQQTTQNTEHTHKGPAQTASQPSQRTTTWKSELLATTSVAVYSSLRQSNSSMRVPNTCREDRVRAHSQVLQ